MPRDGTDSLTAFLGVNLRRDRLRLADGDVAAAINADFHTLPGVMLARLGSRQYFPSVVSAEGDADGIRRLHRRADTRYYVAGRRLYRNETLLTRALDTAQLTTLLSARPLNDTQTWTFIADEAQMYKDNGSALYSWGVAAPSAAPTIAVGAAGSLTGEYGAVYTYARVVDGAVVHESNPSPQPTAVALTADQLTVTVVESLDEQITHIRLYRTVAGGSVYLFDQQVDNTSATVASTQADNALGTAVEDDNDAPPNFSWAAEFQGHLFGCRASETPHYLWFSKRFRPEAWPTEQFLELGTPEDPLQCAISLTGFLGVFSRETKYRVFGNAVSGFAGLESLSKRGTPAPQAAIGTARGALFVARDGVWRTNFLEADQEISQAIEPLFHGQTVNDIAPIDWGLASHMCMAEYKNRLYLGYVDTEQNHRLAVYSTDTQRWYFYDLPARSLLHEERDDQLMMGSSTGTVFTVESPAALGDEEEALALDVTLPDRPGDAGNRLKRFEYVLVDADAKEGTIAALFYVDGVLKHTLRVEGARRRQWQRLPKRCVGRTYRVQLQYSGTERVAVYGVEVRFSALELP